MTAAPTRDLIHRAPKVLLHDHLDGGLRPTTVFDLAAAAGHRLPVDGRARTPMGLALWFRDSADSGSLPRYLETFEHTVAVMQTADGLHRVARECVLDLADDGVIYAEVRYAPELHLTGGLTLPEIIETVNAGFRAGEDEAAALGQRIRVRTILTAMRHADHARQIAALAVQYRDDEVAGFDIAGAEAGHRPSRHLAAFEYLRRENAHFVIHAGEAYGLPSIWEAIQLCGCDRLGHGVRIVDDMTFDGAPVMTRLDDALAEPSRVELGRLAAYVRDRRIPLEMCPHSNVQTGAAESIATHPITLLKALRFRVTLNTDNRLMSATSMTQEMGALVRECGWTMTDLQWVTINAMKSAFLPFDERLALIDHVIKPGYAALGA